MGEKISESIYDVTVTSSTHVVFYPKPRLSEAKLRPEGVEIARF